MFELVLAAACSDPIVTLFSPGNQVVGTDGVEISLHIPEEKDRSYTVRSISVLHSGRGNLSGMKIDIVFTFGNSTRPTQLPIALVFQSPCLHRPSIYLLFDEPHPRQRHFLSSSGIVGDAYKHSRKRFHCTSNFCSSTIFVLHIHGKASQVG